MRALRLVLMFAVACGGKEEETSTTTPGDAVRDACVAQCDDAADGDGCDAEAVRAECDDLCAFSALLLPTECYDLAVALSDCQVGLAYECTGVFSINDVDWPVPVDPTACGDETQALSDCQQGTSTTTP